MHIACVISSMRLGGAERVMSVLANRWVGQGHKVTLITFANPDDLPFFALDEAIVQKKLGEAATERGLARALRTVRRIKGIRRELLAARPDCVLSFIDLNNVMTLLALKGLDLPVVVSERIDPHKHVLGRISDLLRRKTYPRADRLVVQTRRAASYFPDYPRDKMVVLANPIGAAERLATPDVPGRGGRFRIMATGRYTPMKGHDLLIDAFALLAEKHPDWDVVFFGHGPSQAQLQSRIDGLGLGGRMRLMPPTTAIFDELAQSHIFGFPSYYEGFPNALVEALSAGLPAVGFREVSGVEDLIGHEVCGFLCDFGAGHDDAVRSLASRLDTLMGDGPLRSRMGAVGRERIADYQPDVILEKWDKLISDVAAGRARGSAAC
ncbi:MAG: glycosyltransferase family 4 protein [Hyphomicrobiaceae bacterium]